MEGEVPLERAVIINTHRLSLAPCSHKWRLLCIWTRTSDNLSKIIICFSWCAVCWVASNLVVSWCCPASGCGADVKLGQWHQNQTATSSTWCLGQTSHRYLCLCLGVFPIRRAYGNIKITLHVPVKAALPPNCLLWAAGNFFDFCVLFIYSCLFFPLLIKKGGSTVA